MTPKTPLLRLLNLLTGAGILLASPALATQPGEPSPEVEPASPVKKKSPYSLPWQLRPAMPGSVVRSDTSVAMFDVKTPAGDASGSTIASMLLFSYKVSDALAPLVRLGYVTTKLDDADRVSAFVNPVVGATYGMPIGDDLKLGLFLGVALPLGQGGGDRGDPTSDTSKRYAAASSGIYARAAMDNAMFAVNYLTVFPGVGLAYVSDGLTIQGEVTVLSLNRARGDDAVEADKSRWNLTSGLHVGYFVLDMLSLGAELRYQRWLSTPKFVETDEDAPADAQRGLRDQATFAVGPRLHVELGPGLWLRPGIAYSRGIDKPMAGANVGPTNYNIVQLDVPLAF
ncbi:MAG: hypothetical protein KF718_00920 [Polyangiaceae bacterium]|nr:hypothetical protein [Polyangiaceae bacterium]